MSTQLAFHETQFNVVNHNNQIWLTAVEIAKALRYKSDDSVTKIYNRNHEEFSAGMSETVNLTASGNYQKTVRIFSLRGAHLIAMFARTPVAKEFRRWVLDILDREVSSPEIRQQFPSPHRIGSFSMVVDFENDLPVCSRILTPGEQVMTYESFLEMALRAGHIVLPCDEVGKFTMDEIQELVNKARKLRSHWDCHYKNLA